MPAPIDSFLVPPFLRKGDTVGLVAPSRGVEYNQIRAWVEWMERRGFEVEVGLSIGQFKHQLAGTDEERAADLQGFLNRPDITALFMARGGRGGTDFGPGGLVGPSPFSQMALWLQRFHRHSELCTGPYRGCQPPRPHALSIQHHRMGDPKLGAHLGPAGGRFPQTGHPLHCLCQPSRIASGSWHSRRS